MAKSKKRMLTGKLVDRRDKTTVMEYFEGGPPISTASIAEMNEREGWDRFAYVEKKQPEYKGKAYLYFDPPAQCAACALAFVRKELIHMAVLMEDGRSFGIPDASGSYLYVGKRNPFVIMEKFAYTVEQEVRRLDDTEFRDALRKVGLVCDCGRVMATPERVAKILGPSKKNPTDFGDGTTGRTLKIGGAALLLGLGAVFAYRAFADRA